MRRRDVPATTRRTRRAANVAGLAVVAFAVLSLTTTQIAPIRAVVPWADDPYDAVVWSAMLLVSLSVVVTWIRSVRYRGTTEIPAAARRRIHRGVGLAVAAVLVAVASDTVALAGSGMPDAAPTVTATVVALLAATGMLASAAAVLLLQAVRSMGRVAFPPGEPDALDEALALVQDAATLLRPRAPRESHALDRAVVATAAFLERSRLSPRRHVALAITLVAVAGGGVAVGWHAFAEGAWASPVAAALFAGLAGAGILVVLGGVSGYLRLVQPA